MESDTFTAYRWSEQFPEQHLPHPRYTCGRVIWGILPTVLLEAQQEHPAQQEHDDMVMPSHPSASLVLIKTDITLFGLELGLNTPPAPAHVGTVQGGLERSCCADKLP